MAVDLWPIVEEYVAGLIDDSVSCLRSKAVSVAPRATGELARSADVVRVDRLTVELSFSTPQGWYTDKGTKPHPIKPVAKKALFWDGAAHPVRSVNHPGSTKHKGWFSDRDWGDDWVECLG